MITRLQYQNLFMRKYERLHKIHQKAGEDLKGASGRVGTTISYVICAADLFVSELKTNPNPNKQNVFSNCFVDLTD